MGETEIDEVAGPRDPFAIHDVELRRAEWRGDLVLDHLELGPAADRLLAFLDGADPPDVDPDRGIELESATAGRRLGIAEHDADLLADLVDEDEAGFRLRDDPGQLTQRLRHQARLQPDVAVSHLALELGARDKRCDRVDDAHVERARADEHLEDLERLLAGVGLGHEEVVDIHAELLGILGVHRVLGVDEGRDAAAPLRLGHDVEGERRLSRGFRAEHLDHAASREAADAEGPIDRKRAGRDGRHLDGLAASELDDGTLPELLLDLGHRHVDSPRLLAEILYHDTPLRTGRRGSGGNRGSTEGAILGQRRPTGQANSRRKNPRFCLDRKAPAP